MAEEAGSIGLETIARWLRALGAELSGYEIELRAEPPGPAAYLRWSSRSVKRQVEVLVPPDPAAGGGLLTVLATASKARRDRSTKIASLAPPVSAAEFERAARAAIAWAERWDASDFFA